MRTLLTKYTLLAFGIIALSGIAFALRPDWFELSPLVPTKSIPSERARLDIPATTTEEPSQYLTVSNLAKASPGYTLIPLVGNAKILLVDMKGHTVQEWEADATRARLLPDRRVIVVHGSKWGRETPPWAKLRPLIVEYGPKSERVWEYRASDRVHHDVRRLPNGNTMFLIRDLLKKSVGEIYGEPSRVNQVYRSDAIVEINPKKEVVWTWHADEHLDLKDTGRRVFNPVHDDKPRPEYDWTHMNTISVLPENKWYDEGHTAFRPGNILIMPRNLWEAMIIDKESKKIVWRYGGDYGGGLEASHEPQMIAKGLPGEGNILIFDNGVQDHDKKSYVIEVNPVTKKVVWAYDAGKKFYSRRRGSVQRLPNGNTLISEDEKGRCFEVTPDQEIVWSYEAGREISRCQRYGLESL